VQIGQELARTETATEENDRERQPNDPEIETRHSEKDPTSAVGWAGRPVQERNGGLSGENREMPAANGQTPAKNATVLEKIETLPNRNVASIDGNDHADRQPRPVTTQRVSPGSPIRPTATQRSHTPSDEDGRGSPLQAGVAALVAIDPGSPPTYEPDADAPAALSLECRTPYSAYTASPTASHPTNRNHDDGGR
jgi:hypothetical protein